MSCPWREKVARYVDHELDAKDEQQFSAHLRDCPECTAAVNEQMALKKAVRSARLRNCMPPSTVPFILSEA